MGSSQLRGLISQARSETKKIQCTMCRLLSELTGDDRAALSEALGDSETSAGVIAKALTGYGVKVSSTAISRHRRECKPIQ